MRGRTSTTDELDAVQAGFALAARLPGRSVQAIRKLRLSIGLPRPHCSPFTRGVRGEVPLRRPTPASG